jgi:hypothetical protein
MAIVSNIDDEENQPQQGSVVGQTNAAAATPQSTVTTGGGGLGGGKAPSGPTPTGGAAASVASTPTVANTAGNFTNLQSYLNENPNEGQNIANKIATSISGQNNQAENAISSGVQQFNTDVNTGTVNLDTNLINSALGDPNQIDSTSGTAPTTATTEADTASFANNADNVSNFQKQYNGTYTGPTSLQNDATAYNPINQAVTNAQSYAGQVGTAGGRENLIANLSPTGTNLTQGDIGLNNFFLQSSPEAMQTLAQPNVNLLNDVNTAQNNALNTAAQGQQTSANTANYVQGQTANAYKNIENDVNNQVSNLQGQAQTNFKNLQDTLTTNGTLTDAQVSSLGLTNTQWTALQNLATQYSTDIGTQNNLALLGAESLGGMNPGIALIPTSGSQTQTGGLLSNILSAGSTAVGGAEMAGTVNSLLGNASSGVSAAQYVAMTPAQQVATDVAAEQAGMTGEEAADALSAGTSMAAQALPLIGGAITLGQIISTGQFGNGKGGLSGGLSGAMEGASMGAAIGSVIPGVGTAIGAVVGAVAGFLGGLFGGASRGDLYAMTAVNINKDGTLAVGGSGQDNGAANTTQGVATQAVAAINELCAANGLMIVNNGHQFNNTGGNNPNMQLGIYNTTHAKAGGMAADAAGLWGQLVDAGMIVANPNSTVSTNNPLNLSSYVNAATASTNINTANTATAQQYANYAGLNKLTGQNNTFLNQSNAAQAGTATPNIASFDYQSALNNLNQDINTYNTQAPAQQQQALDILRKGLI